MSRINVTKSFMPPIHEYYTYLEKIWKGEQLTNQGPLLREFESSVSDYLKLDSDFHFVTNGTVALQVALKALNINSGEIITTPFSYVATTSAILWEHHTPVFVDINEDDYCIDPDKIEAAITPDTEAILAVHVFGNPCDVESIDKIAKRHSIPVIYDAAHAFGVEYKGVSLLDYGTISTCSFHATKLFHTIEGGAIISADKELSDRIELIKRFGHEGDTHVTLGINAKASEFQAAMGMVNLRHINNIIEKRRNIWNQYTERLIDIVKTPKIKKDTKYNYAYYPVVFRNETQLLNVLSALKKDNVFARRYFYPALNKLPYVNTTVDCPVAEDIAKRIACLPFYSDLSNNDVNRIVEIVRGAA